VNDKRFVTTIAANNVEQPHWSDIFLVEKIPISSCKTMKIELYAFKLRAFRVMR
jgi:hypothetical protein